MVEDLNVTTNELRSERQKLEIVNKELEAFSYSVSHDLRAPLRGIHGFTDILIQEYGDRLDDEGKRLGQIIKKNALDMGKLIDDLLSFSRLGRQALNESLIDMDQMVQSVIQELKTQYPGNMHKINIGKLEPCIGDFSMIRVVMVNLLSNAFKFSSQKEMPVIEISSERQGHKIVYTIRDNGAGFDMKYKDKLFGVFQRLHTVREFEGIGVGLANVKRIITRHGGEIDAEGNPGNGARFWFTLQAQQST
jgi:light-regulated signal transduction histidine kinase (bacteriophytochrome)